MTVKPFNPYLVRGSGLYPPRFKPGGKPPVVGGRWSVRQRLDGKWRAWSHGAASQWGTSFYTWSYAVKWAHYVANVYALAAKDHKLIYIDELKEMRRWFHLSDRLAYQRRIDQGHIPNPLRMIPNAPGPNK